MSGLPDRAPRIAVCAPGTATDEELLLAGAVGNTIDRVRFGAVVDFLDFHVGALHWPAFNIADSAIVIGACLILLDSFGLLEGRHKLGRGEG